MKKNNIPKIIHYCWFWWWKKSESMKKCINSWRKYCPDFEIKEWNESNFDISSKSYTKIFYKKRKWAFVSDYVRIYALHNYWWVYFDTDIELFKNIDNLLSNEAFIGFQDRFSIWWAIIGSQKWNYILKDILDYYQTKKIRIILPNLLNRTFKKYCSIKYTSDIILLEKFTIYPKDYFYPYAYFERPENMEITKNNYTIHYYEATWFPKIVTKVFFPVIWFIDKSTRPKEKREAVFSR